MQHAHPVRVSPVLFFFTLVTLQAFAIPEIGEAQFAIREERRSRLDPFGRRPPPGFFRLHGRDADGHLFKVPMADVRDIRREEIGGQVVITLEVDDREGRRALHSVAGLAAFIDDVDQPIPGEGRGAQRPPSKPIWHFPVGQAVYELEEELDAEAVLWGEDGSLTAEARDLLFKRATQGRVRVMEERSVPLDAEALTADIARHVIGQNGAVRSVVDGLVRVHSRVRPPGRPVSFLFDGPTGVGKTETAKGMQKELFDAASAGDFLRLDMSEYSEAFTISRLLGAPPGYVGSDDGGQLTNSVRENPHRVVLLDEIEKAHPTVLNALLQIVDDGRLTDARGRTVDFSNTVLIMTTNAGRRVLHAAVPGQGRPRIGFHHSSDETVPEARAEAGAEPATESNSDEVLRDKLAGAGAFTPEFLNRIDVVTLYESLNPETVERITDQKAGELDQRLRRQGISLRRTPAAIALLAREGFHPSMGARPVNRVIARRLEAPIARDISRGVFSRGTRLLADVVDGKVVVMVDPEPPSDGFDPTPRVARGNPLPSHPSRPRVPANTAPEPPPRSDRIESPPEMDAPDESSIADNGDSSAGTRDDDGDSRPKNRSLLSRASRANGRGIGRIGQLSSDVGVHDHPISGWGELRTRSRASTVARATTPRRRR